ncbi:MAG: hypothetical protein IKC03_00060, partial [Oscillospiraceae bacterium]|nr:hypothetical protein [Oscillospiraceae bacterium]
MEYKRVDRIMKQVERHYQGEFSINGDWQYSQRLLKRYREESQKKFNGQNGFFGTNRMFCTEGCAREGELFAIPSDQVVYGPYFAFAQGTYYACFDLSGDLSACSVEVSSQKCGVLASGEVGNIEQDGRIMLPFTLPEDVDDLELKVINQGQGLVYFKSVLVTDTLEIRVEKESEKTEIDQETVVAATIPEMMFSKDFGEVAGLIEEAVSLQNVVTKTTREANRAAECALPEQGRFRKVKRLIRKVINCYVHFQLEFNHKVTGGIWTVVQELQLIIEIVKQQFLAIGNLERQIAALREEVVGQKNQLNAQNAIYLQQKAELDAQRAKFGEQKAEFDAQKILFDKQKAIFDEQKAMFELREASYAADLSHYRQETQKLNERVENADRHTSDVLANLETICQKSEEEISKQVEEIARKNEDILCQMRLRFEQLEQMIEHAKNETDQKPVCDDNARTEIGHLWSKIREVDQEFRSVWQSNRDVNANLNSIWHTYNTFRQEVFYEMDHRSRLAGNTQTAQGSK